MNRAQRRASHFKRLQRWDRNEVNAVSTAALEPILYHRQYTDEQAAELTNMARMAWHRLTTGAGTQDDYYTLAAISNQVLVRAEGIDELLVEVALRAQTALVAMAQRFERLARWGVDAAGLADVPPMLDLYYEIVSLSSPQQMISASQQARARMNAGQVAA